MPRREPHRSSPEDTARYYDQTAKATGWIAPQVAFGMLYEYVEAGQSLLDLGIGTGLSSVLFRRAGLRVSGMDADPEMIEVCRWKHALTAQSGRHLGRESAMHQTR
jgi:2-polyprenyl-3-methyl-5-hydroxy-6-metoxy-1,4-benzoquinol methylase